MAPASDLIRWAGHRAQNLCRRLGLELVRYYDPNFFAVKRMEILRDQRISLVLDVGANAGQYAEAIRANGFQGKIISFEPTSEAFVALNGKTARDESWSCEKLALSDADEDRAINVSANSWSSSLLPMADKHLKSAPDSSFVGAEVVGTSRLDTVSSRLLHDNDRIFLKLDVQGHELWALRGGERTLSHVYALECELTVVTLYQGQALIGEILEYLDRRDFELVALEPAYIDPRSGQLLQFDGLFLKRG
jgi:FkbM family methyltransferase